MDEGAPMKDTINAKIKRRESFRPFAPSVLREAVGNYVEQALDCFARTDMYALCLGQWVLAKASNQA